MRIDVVVNPRAGRGKGAQRGAEVHAELDRLGLHVTRHVPASRSDADAVLNRLATTAERVVVVGGDGIVHQAANALVGTEVVLGIVASGTGNDTVTGLGLPDDTAQAVAAACGDAVAIDLIRCEAGVAVTIAAMGFGVAVNERAETMSFPKGGSKYTVASLLHLRHLAPEPCVLVVDGVSHEIAPNMISIANTTHFGGGMKVAPHAKPDDGLLDVVVMGPASRTAFVRLLPTVFSGRHVRSPYVQIFRGAEVRLESSTARVRADGEPFGVLPMTFTAESAALSVAGIGL